MQHASYGYGLSDPYRIKSELIGLTKSPQHNGRPTFKYTRIEITGTLERLAAGESVDELVDGYRGRVSKEAIMEAVSLITDQFIASLPQLEPA